MPLDDVQKEVTTLKRRRGVIKGSLTRIRNFIKDFNTREQPISLLEFRQDELPQINKKFDDIQSQIELLSNEFEQEEEERNTFENEYFNLRSQIQELVNAQKLSSTIGPNVSFGSSSAAHSVRLAPIPLPNFDGDIQKWEAFIDLFRALVHNDDSISAAQKHIYLRSSLSGAALDLVNSVPMTEANYELALRRLEQRYDNKSLVIQSHIKAILNTPTIAEPSAKEFQKLHSHISTQVAALRALSQPVQYWDAWLITIVTSCMDTSTNHEWQLRQPNTNLPKYEDLENFLASRCVAFESSEASSKIIKGALDNASFIKANNKKPFPISKRVLVASAGVDSCQCCKGEHKLYNCDNFKSLPTNVRLSLAQENRICFNCLSPGHMSSKCRSTYCCRICKRKHHSLLHFEKQKMNEDKVQQNNQHAGEDQGLSNSSVTVTASAISTPRKGHVFLATALVMVRDINSQFRNCRVILDSGSQVNFISKSLARLLQLPSKKALVPISGIGDNRLRVSSYVEVQIQSRVSDYSINISCYILPNITGELSSCREPTDGWNIPKELFPYLADPKFHHPKSIELLVGGGTFFDILGAQRRHLNEDSVCLQESHFGWLVTGELASTSLTGIESVGQATEKDWQALNVTDDINYGRESKSNRKSIEEQEAIQHFKQNTIRDTDGRFVVRLPVKHSIAEMGTTSMMATSRFLSVERRLQHDEYLRNEYTKFMAEYIRLGHMQEVVEDVNLINSPCYLPHHAIMKTSSLTTKVRVVFDASAKGSSGISLNDVLKCGPTVQQDLFSILVRFRKHQFVITSDVEKMFRQIKVARADWDLQRIVWRADPKEPLRNYHLTTITYGTTPAAFLATSCLITLGEDVKQKFPKAAKAIIEDFYMDDLMTGADTEDECCQLQKDISTTLDSAKLPLRKWCSNSEYVLHSISKTCADDPLYILDIADDDTVKTLGLQWKPTADRFQFKIMPQIIKRKLTKRVILSELNRIFDPLGFLSPVLVKGKIFLQQMWAMKAGWDHELPSDIQEKWCRFYKELEQLETLTIPRKTQFKRSNVVEMHGFCDASEEAFGACVYIRSRDNEGNWYSSLLCSKTRVAPLKGNTIPRLELNGALLLAELIQKVANSWEINAYDFRLWTDSTIVLGWLYSQKSRLKIYIANRVSQILELTRINQWNYIKSEENPADIPSRGLRPQELITSKLWWNGPEWMTKDEDSWEKSTNLLIDEKQLPEQRPIRFALISIEPSKDLINKYSNFRRAVRAVAWIKRFIEFIRSKRTISESRFLTVNDLKLAENILIKRAQMDEFRQEFDALNIGKEVSKNSKLKTLCPFISYNGIILVGGRLKYADNISHEQRHPIVLPANHKITRLIFEDYHRLLLHCGPQALLAEVRQRYWPLRGRVMARSVTSRCIICIRSKPKFENPLMAPLPKQRVQITRPFTVTGVDFAGPLLIRSGIRRVTAIKVWIAVFVCFSTRAIHLEAVVGLTSEAFLAALRRFMSRRGKCMKIFSDNATNFVGAKKELATYMVACDNALAKEGVQWHFNPPSAPHFGGLWESAVKSTKYHLFRVIKDTRLNLEELQTLLCQIEACVNSRPMTPLSSDPNEPNALTPAHFLIGGPLLLPPEPDIPQGSIGHLRRWKYVQGLMQIFWRRWHKEYLPQLQIRGRWLTSKRQLDINDIVIIKEDGTLPTKWKLGRIIELHPGSDGIVRVVSLQTPLGTRICRPAAKLCRLPLEEDSPEVETHSFQRGEDVEAVTQI